MSDAVPTIDIMVEWQRMRWLPAIGSCAHEEHRDGEVIGHVPVTPEQDLADGHVAPYMGWVATMWVPRGYRWPEKRWPGNAGKSLLIPRRDEA